MPEASPNGFLTDSNSKSRLIRHLDNCLSEISTDTTQSKDCKSNISSPNIESLSDTSNQITAPLDFSKTGQNSVKVELPKQDENNNRDKGAVKRKSGKTTHSNGTKKAKNLGEKKEEPVITISKIAVVEPIAKVKANNLNSNVRKFYLF